MFSRGWRVANGLSTRIAKQNQIKCALDELPFNVGVGLFFHGGRPALDCDRLHRETTIALRSGVYADAQENVKNFQGLLPGAEATVLRSRVEDRERPKLVSLHGLILVFL